MQPAWRLSHRADPRACAVADRHYNRQKPGTPQFVPPGRCMVLYGEHEAGRALWVTSWPFPEFVRHAWPGAWICSAFRNEGYGVASQLITAAVAATRAAMSDPPALGMITFLNRECVRPTMTRGKPTWGRTWHLAGFRPCGETGSGLMALRLAPEDMPAPQFVAGMQPCLW